MDSFPQPTERDIVALAVTFTYSLLLLATAEAIRILFQYDTDFTRKVIHIGAGTWAWGVFILFEKWQFAIIPFGIYIAITYLALRLKLLKSMDPSEGATPGTIYFCFSITVLFYVFHAGFDEGWPRGREYLAMSGIMAMTFGDAMASIVGRRSGTRPVPIPFAILNKTIEGSWACFVSIVVVEVFTLGVLAGPTIGQSGVIFGALTAAVLGTWLEAISPWGTDNLTVPFGVSFGLWLFGY
ncbi:phosphatidate cytidylyltransferase [Jimgerdemannia flammicorona]|uniref:Phosphatidate cytidylyltransferase n=1 Tax=Jimgerdemannia flammicorona TaxID=994334 RepID=A0A433QPI0_9FUNG|nr:phosphatidate cytidylyltransferase [Jimgerdemannia flammicorona]